MVAIEINQAIEIEQARLTAGLARMVRDIGLAEARAPCALALVTAVSRWPKTGDPTTPEAKRRAIDGLCRNKMLARKPAEFGRDLGP